MKVFYDKDCDLFLIKGKNVCICQGVPTSPTSPITARDTLGASSQACLAGER